MITKFTDSKRHEEMIENLLDDRLKIQKDLG